MLASADGRVEVVRILLEAGASKDLVNNDGYTALMLASADGRVEVARVLLEACANRDFADNDCFTAKL